MINFLKDPILDKTNAAYREKDLNKISRFTRQGESRYKKDPDSLGALSLVHLLNNREDLSNRVLKKQILTNKKPIIFENPQDWRKILPFLIDLQKDSEIKDESLQMKIALALAKSGNSTKGLYLARQILKENSTITNRYLYGEILFTTGFNYADAAEQFSWILNKKPNHFNAQKMLIESMFKDGSFETLNVLNQFIENYENNNEDLEKKIELIGKRGRFNLNQNDVSASQKDFRLIEKLGFTDELLGFHINYDLFGKSCQSNFRKGIEYANKSLEYGLNNLGENINSLNKVSDYLLKVLDWCIKSNYNLGNFQEVIEYGKIALRHNVLSPEIFFFLGITHERRMYRKDTQIEQIFISEQDFNLSRFYLERTLDFNIPDNFREDISKWIESLDEASRNCVQLGANNLIRQSIYIN